MRWCRSRRFHRYVAASLSVGLTSRPEVDGAAVSVGELGGKECGACGTCAFDEGTNAAGAEFLLFVFKLRECMVFTTGNGRGETS